MADQTHTERTNSVLKELFDLWDSRAGLYSEVMYSSALLHVANSWRNVFTFFHPLHKHEQRATTLDVNYGDFTLCQGLLRIEDAKQTLTEVAEKEKLSLPDRPSVEIKASLHPGSSRHFWRGDSKTYPVGFPFFEYRFGVEQTTRAAPRLDTIWAPNLPLYPSGDVAIEELFFTRLGRGGSAYDGVLSILVPDYRGKIAGIRLMNGGIEVEAKALLGADPKDLAGKLYYEGPYGNRYNEDLEFDGNGKALISTKDFPRHFVAVLFSKSTGDMIDERTFDATSPYLPSDLTIEEVGKDIENLVRGGESDTIEFKVQIAKNSDKIAIAAVAFANQRGGTIFVGVDDEGQMIGISGENIKETLTNILRDRCEPPLDFGIQEATVQEKHIFVVTVTQGKDTPYQVKDRGFYIRTGATNRLITRYELDAMYGVRPENLSLG
jgi:Putative DNA-binding domain